MCSLDCCTPRTLSTATWRISSDQPPGFSFPHSLYHERFHPLDPGSRAQFTKTRILDPSFESYLTPNRDRCYESSGEIGDRGWKRAMRGSWLFARDPPIPLVRPGKDARTPGERTLPTIRQWTESALPGDSSTCNNLCVFDPIKHTEA